MKNKNKFFLATCIIIALVFIMYLSVFLNQNNTTQKDLLLDTPIVKISLKELEDAHTLKKEGIYYIGRPSCPGCEDYLPKLTSILNQYNLSANYYNTELDRSTSYEEMMRVLNIYNVNSVPVLLILSDGEIAYYFSGVDIYEQTVNHFDT